MEVSASGCVWPGEAYSTILTLPIQVCPSSGDVMLCFKRLLHPVGGGCQVGVLGAFVSHNLAVKKLCGITVACTW